MLRLSTCLEFIFVARGLWTPSLGWSNVSGQGRTQSKCTVIHPKVTTLKNPSLVPTLKTGPTILSVQG